MAGAGHDPGELLNHLERAAAVADDDAAAGARVLAALAVGHCYHPDPTIAAGHLDRAEALAASTGDADVIADFWWDGSSPIPASPLSAGRRSTGPIN